MDIKQKHDALNKIKNMFRCRVDRKNASISNILQSIDNDFIKECILNGIELGINPNISIELIKNLNDIEFFEECILQNNKVGLTKNDIEILKLFFCKDYLKKYSINGKFTIKLPKNMKIGIEIECIGKYNNLLSDFLHREISMTWECKRDSTIIPDVEYLEDGLEITPPPLTGDFDCETKRIQKTCAILNAFGQYTNETCGGHIHIDYSYLTSTQSFRNFMNLYANTEMILYLISNKKGDIPRQLINSSASPVSKHWKQKFKDGSVYLHSIEDIENFKYQLTHNQEDRNVGVNFLNLHNLDGKKTIEFRIPNGTVDADTWIANINLFGGLVKSAEDLFKIQSKNDLDRTEEERRKLFLFNKLKSENLSEKEKLDILLEIVIDEEDRYIYQERYEENSILLKDNAEREKLLKDKATEEAIDFDRD